jgi:hypothetical protein
MYKNATKCNETIGKWCKTKHGASKIIDTFETYHATAAEAAEQAVHWAAEMDKAVAYRRDVDRNTAARRDAGHRAKTEREAGRRANTEHHIERRMTVRRQEATIRVTMVAIEAADVGGHGDEGACSRVMAAMAT